MIGKSTRRFCFGSAATHDKCLLNMYAKFAIACVPANGAKRKPFECRLLPNQTPLETVFLVWLAPRVDTGEVHVNFATIVGAQ